MPCRLASFLAYSIFQLAISLALPLLSVFPFGEQLIFSSTCFIGLLHVVLSFFLVHADPWHMMVTGLDDQLSSMIMNPVVNTPDTAVSNHFIALKVLRLTLSIDLYDIACFSSYR